MPKGFKGYEKHVITNSLIEQGKVLFSKFGLQKTSINEITKNVGIAPGTFYKFYNSKEELYFEILEKEEEQIKKQFLSIDIQKDNQPKQEIKKLLLQTIDIIETNPLIRQLYFENNMEALLRKLPPEKLVEHYNNDSAALFPLIEKWQKEGVLLEANPEIIAAMLRSLFLLTLHKKEIGVEVYTETIELFIDLIVDGLIKEEGE
ncbi:TetR/AcrR family transcriptional regulator [Salicibibacter cibarius]|uniref:DNA-binding transcriptional regulator, AcrR family n=2 Tax=Bacillaceae TaxID=186817 RepID=A0A1G8Q252_9BACI|nr:MULTISPECIES: TetR/AcrR family transcriptional regulator [Bacillaceae]QQK75431.1 TetR/AcrR family transcriptional regulator [Salicibibacter cibarius]SDI98170.1 DNA-binding transcriptional regulator, AcrR family [Natribacillus halophilus]